MDLTVWKMLIRTNSRAGTKVETTVTTTPDKMTDSTAPLIEINLAGMTTNTVTDTAREITMTTGVGIPTNPTPTAPIPPVPREQMRTEAAASAGLTPEAVQTKETTATIGQDPQIGMTEGRTDPHPEADLATRAIATDLTPEEGTTGQLHVTEKTDAPGTKPPIETEEGHQTEMTKREETPETEAILQLNHKMGTEIDPHHRAEIRGQGKVIQHQMTKPPPKWITRPPPVSTTYI